MADMSEELAKSVKMSDMSAEIAATVFMKLNPLAVTLLRGGCQTTIVTDIEPKDLVYPEGWYYDNGLFTNRSTSTDGYYSEIRMIKESGEFWGNVAKYSTYSE